MELVSFQVRGCFGFQDSGRVQIKEPGNLVYLLGRNSSGKTAFLQALRHLESGLAPSAYDNFDNYNPVDDLHPHLLAKFTCKKAELDAAKLVSAVKKGLPQQIPAAWLQEERANRLFDGIRKVYTHLFSELESTGEVWVEKRANGAYLILGQPGGYKVYRDRVGEVKKLISREFPQGKLNWQKIEIPVPLTEQTAENLVFHQFPKILFFQSAFSLTENLPDRIAESTGSVSSYEETFRGFLGKKVLARFLVANDPDERDELLRLLQIRADLLSNHINKTLRSPRLKGANLIQVRLHAKEGLQITMETDKKKSFYRHLSENSKVLVAYHLYAAQEKIERDVLLFDEPNLGFHATAQEFLLEFLSSLADAGNQLVVSTHSEHLIDLQRIGAVRLLGKDKDRQPIVRNHPYQRARTKGDYLSLQPILDAIGLRYGSSLVVRREVILTEGITDLMYIKGYYLYLRRRKFPALAPSRGDNHFFNLVPFFVAQGVGIRLVIDTGGVRRKLQEAFGIDDRYIFEIAVPEEFAGQTERSGIEDLFTKEDFGALLAEVGIETSDKRFGRVTNSEFVGKHPAKRLIAQRFMELAGEDNALVLSKETRLAFEGVVEFCSGGEWFVL